MNAAAPSRLIRAAVLVIAGGLVLAAAAVGTTAVTAPGCESCHARVDSSSQSLAAGQHAALECASCHAPQDPAARITFGSRVVFGMTLRIGGEGDRAYAAVSDATCLSCHGEVMERPSASRGYLIDHVSCAEGAACTDCHSATAHGDTTTWKRTAEMGQCLGCHSAREAAAACDTCHDPHTKSERLAVGGAWQVTHGSQWTTTHGMGDLGTCAACHSRDYCVDCHGVSLPHPDRYVENAHSAEANAKPASCEGCHQRAFCDSCHGIEMPHDPSFVQSHSATVEAETDVSCVRCHTDADCTTCHVKHVHPVTLEQMGGDGR
ncbi:MAG: hypothetical protein ACYDHQ_02075 [Coriobacteriia bacterium]